MRQIPLGWSWKAEISQTCGMKVDLIGCFISFLTEMKVYREKTRFHILAALQYSCLVILQYINYFSKILYLCYYSYQV